MKHCLVNVLLCGIIFRYVLSEFLAGVDVSHINLFEKHGAVYRDYDGRPIDLFDLLKKYGINCIRLRLFTSSEEQARDNPMDSAQTLNYTLNLALRVKKKNLPFLLDIHYSDSWADPGKQTKPSKWVNLTFEQLKQQVYEYTRDTIKAFIQQDTLPDYIQIGNEITAGILWPDGKWTDWKKFAILLRAAIKGVRDVTQKPKTILHVTYAAKWEQTKYFFDQVTNENIPFDIIAQSYYPFWHKSIDDVEKCLIKTAERYKKPIIIMETAFPWIPIDPSNRDSVKNMTGIDGGPQGQVDFVRKLANTLKELPNNRGFGIFWWAAEYQSIMPGLAGFDLRSFFNKTGHPFPILREFGKLREGLPSGLEWTFITGIITFIVVILIFTVKSIKLYRRKKVPIRDKLRDPLLEVETKYL
jgi:arabinogalactan endo-1,4-beta-galactosidase